MLPEIVEVVAQAGPQLVEFGVTLGSGVALGIGLHAWKTRYNARCQREADERKFWAEVRRGAWGTACDIATVMSAWPQSDSERMRWRNNSAYCYVQMADYGTARNLLAGVLPPLREREKIAVIGNRAWVHYYDLDESVRKHAQEYVQCLTRACEQYPDGDDKRLGWLQLWDRRPLADIEDRGLVSPYGILGRLLASGGDWEGAVAAFRSEVLTEKENATAARTILGFLGIVIADPRITKHHLDNVDLSSVPDSSRAHHRANCEMLKILVDGNLSKTLGLNTFESQARGPKSGYYAFSGYADVTTFLSTKRPAMQRMRHEYGRRLIDGYAVAGKSDLEPIVQLRQLLSVN